MIFMVFAVLIKMAFMRFTNLSLTALLIFNSNGFKGLIP